MTREQKSTIIWILVLVTVIGSVATFLFTLPDFSSAVWVDYGKDSAATKTTTTPTTVKALAYPLNINTATKEELMTISGIGEVYAERILAYREENGDFTALEQLTEIEGVGEKRLETWREYLCCE